MGDTRSTRLDSHVNDEDANDNIKRDECQLDSAEVVEVVRESIGNLDRSSDNGLAVGAPKIYRGHHFKDTIARDNARVQYGDVYNIGACAHSSLALQRQPNNMLRTEKFEEVQV